MATAAVRNPWAIGAGATAFLLPVAYSPSVHGTFWSPKLAVLLVAGAAGLSRVPALLRTPLRRPTIAALAFLAVATLSTAIAPRPVEALVGQYLLGTGLVFIAGLVGVWALGASSAAEGQRAVVVGLLAGSAVSCGVAIVVTTLDISLSFVNVVNRATGLAGYAMHLGTISVAGLALAVWFTATRWVALAGVAAFAAAAQLSGTRSALVCAAVVVIVLGLLRAPRRVPAMAVAFALGFALSSATASSDTETATSRGIDASALSVASGGGVGIRVEVWSYARHAVVDRPLLGAGPGRFRAATSADRTRGVALAEGPTALYADAHNLAVEHLVTTGFMGLAALTTWLVLATRRARGPLAAAAVVIALLSAVQPQSVGVTPLLFLALGGAAAVPVEPTARRSRVASGLAIAAAASVAIVLLAGDVFLERMNQTFSLTDGRRADALLRPWPEPATVIARAHELRALDEPAGDGRDAENAEARRWHAIALSRDPTRPDLLIELAGEERYVGLDDDAERHFLDAIRHDPFAIQAMVGLGDIARDRGARDEALAWYERALDFFPDDERIVERIESVD